jgi:adenine-specific DNA-methyltransferase
MTITEIKEILENPYNRKVWKGFLQTQFTNNKLNAEDRVITLADKTLSNECLSLGNYEIDKYTLIGIFEIHLNENVRLTRNRVGLRNLIKSITAQVAGAMVVFIQGDKWRFSYISKRKVKNDETNLVENKETAPKRYTYLFGKGEKAKTAADRFFELIEKQKDNSVQSLSLNDFEIAFSVEKLSKDFFDQYKKTYEDFVEYLTGKRYKKTGNRYLEQVIKVPNYQLDGLFGNNEKKARDFCKRMMGRIVFLYFIQKKGWLAVKKGKSWGEGKINYLYDLFNESNDKDNFYKAELVDLFFTKLNNPNSEDENNDLRFPYLNGGLFDDTQDKNYNRLQLPGVIFDNLFETFNNFNFTVYEDAPDEHTIAVDPEMLGHIFENLLEDNKDKGAFYTPKEIVHFMCQESIENYLMTKNELNFDNQEISKSAIHKLIHQIDLNETEKAFAEKNAYKIIDSLENVKICDPAIGSGAFPMGILQEIFNAQIYLQELKGFKRINEAEIKKHIIQESIYGVDIDNGAVDIARLRFWLSLIVDEPVPHPLPNLDYKIITGNSLISRFDISEPIDEVFKNLNTERKKKELSKIDVKDYKELMNKYLNTSEKHSKVEFSQLINEVKATFLTTLTAKNINTVSVARGKYQNLLGKDLLGKPVGSALDVLNAKEKFEQAEKDLEDIKMGAIYKNAVEWRFEFPAILNDKGDFEGFDIVIGNPPYIKEYTNKAAFDGFRRSKYYQGKMDLWYGFASVMLDKLNPNGVQCFIAQNNWITSSGASKLREKILDDAKILSFIDFGNYKVFASAGIQTMIYVVKKAQVKTKETYTVKYALLTDENLPEDQLVDFLNFDVEAVFSQKYLFDITPNSNNSKPFTFNTTDDEVLLNEIASKSNYKLSEKDVAQGIVPNPDVVNSRNIEKIPRDIQKQNHIKVGDGVFVVEKGTFESLSEIEKKYVKPVFEPNEVSRYRFVKEYNSELLYITKGNYQNDAPNLLRHLEKYRAIMDDRRENQNGRLEFYHLHWPRDEFYFLEGPKILSVRKCNKPTFVYTEQSAFVMMSFNIIKANSVNHKFLTALLNSNVIEYWLKNKGKMQGNNFQIDKEPLLNLPLVITEDTTQFEILVDYLIYLYDGSKPNILSHTDNKRIAAHIEAILNMLVYELYFLNHMKEVGIDVAPFVNAKPFESAMSEKDKADIIKDFYLWFQLPQNPVRQRMLLIDTRSDDKISVINKNTL